MILVAQDSVSAYRINWVGIGIGSSRILVAFLINFGILSEIEGFIDLLHIDGICSLRQGVGS